jgi:D-arabinose 1-dehydrogenase-like Zn-dependent alcohol dehydrogenase
MLSVMSTTRNQLAQVLDIMGRDEIKAVVGDLLPLEEVARAHRMVASGESAGRILLSPKLFS